MIYNLQGTLYPSGSPLSQIILFALLAISIRNVYKLHLLESEKPSYIQGLNILVLLFTIYGVVLLLTSDGLSHEGIIYKPFMFLKSVYSSLLPIYSFFYYTKIGLLNLKLIQRWTIVFLLISIAEYYRLQQMTLELMYSLGSNATEVTNNAGYIVLSLLPSCLLFYRKPILSYAFLLIVFAFVMMAMKRGAILVLFLSVFICLLWFIKNSNNNKSLYYLISIIILLLGYKFYTDYMLQSDYFNARLERTLEGDSSGRYELYTAMISNFFDKTNAFQFFFGYGAYGALKVVGNFAHNDWLEILTSHGILGIVLYLIYWKKFINTIRDAYYNELSKFILIIVFVICFTKTLFSGSYADMHIYMTCVFGYVLAGGLNEDYNYEDFSIG